MDLLSTVAAAPRAERGQSLRGALLLHRAALGRAAARQRHEEARARAHGVLLLLLLLIE